MSILLLTMSLLAVFYWFYQSVIVQTNLGLYETDLNLRKHELDIYEIKKQYSMTASEREHLEETKELYEIYKILPKEVTFLESICAAPEKDSVAHNNFVQAMRERKIASPELHKSTVTMSLDLMKTLGLNASIFLILLSPLIILAMLYLVVAGKKLSLEKQIEKVIASKHC